MNRIHQMIAGGLTAAFLAAPAFAQGTLRMNDCTKILPAGQAGCKADNDLRSECIAKSSNPLQCYNAKIAAAQAPAPATKPAAPAPATASAAKAPTPAPTPAPAPTAATPAPSNTGLLTSVPPGLKACATDGKSCAATGNWTGVYGANDKYAKIAGSGKFTCLPKDLKVDDPAPKVAKTCYITASAIAAAPAPAPKATTPVATAQPKVNPLPLSCKGGQISSPTRKFASRGDFEKNGYGMPDAMVATDLVGATDECRASCAKTGEPAPCGWFTLVQWRNDSSATGKSSTSYTCHKVGARNYKDAFKPTLPNDKNFGDPSNGLFFRDAWTYPCAR